MQSAIDTAIVGAGPYGLSISAHLGQLGEKYRTFGTPMRSWIREMPNGMHLKSDGFASNIYDPCCEFTLKHFCGINELPYDDFGHPISLNTFVEYGLAFQKRFVPAVENKSVVELRRSGEYFQLTLDDGDSFAVRRVVLAVGLTYFRHIPPTLLSIPESLRSHSADYGQLDSLRGRTVFVIGGGASAIDIAGLLGNLGGQVHLFAREAKLHIHTKGHFPRGAIQRLRQPMSGIGPGWRSLFYCTAPNLFHYLPEKVRLHQAQRYPAPAGGWFMAKSMEKVHLHLGYRLISADASSDGKSLIVTFVGPSASIERFECEHVIAATGYSVDLSRIPFLCTELRSQIRATNGVPILSTDLESSVRGLFFVGPASAYSIGPIARFAAGARYAAKAFQGTSLRS